MSTQEGRYRAGIERGDGVVGGSGSGLEPPLPPELSPRLRELRADEERAEEARAEEARTGTPTPVPAARRPEPPLPRRLNPRGPDAPAAPADAARGPAAPATPRGPGQAPGRRRWSRRRRLRFTLFLLVTTLLLVGASTCA